MYCVDVQACVVCLKEGEDDGLSFHIMACLRALRNEAAKVLHESR